MSIIQAFMGEPIGSSLPAGCYEHQRQSGTSGPFRAYTDIERHIYKRVPTYVGNFVSDIGKILVISRGPLLTSAFPPYEPYYQWYIEYIDKNGYGGHPLGGAGPNGGIVMTWACGVVTEQQRMVVKYQPGYDATNSSCIITGGNNGSNPYYYLG